MHMQIQNFQNQVNGVVNKADGGPGTYIYSSIRIPTYIYLSYGNNRDQGK